MPARGCRAGGVGVDIRHPTDHPTTPFLTCPVTHDTRSQSRPMSGGGYRKWLPRTVIPIRDPEGLSGVRNGFEIGPKRRSRMTPDDLGASNFPASGRIRSGPVLLATLWEQVVAGSIPAAPTSTSASLARDLLTHRRATRPDAASIACLVPSLRCASRGARLFPSGRLLAPRPGHVFRCPGLPGRAGVPALAVSSAFLGVIIGWPSIRRQGGRR